MDLDLFMEQLKLALKYVENAQFLIMKAQQQCQKVKNENDWLDNAYSLLNACDFDIDSVIETLKAIIEESGEELTERKK